MMLLKSQTTETTIELIYIHIHLRLFNPFFAIRSILCQHTVVQHAENAIREKYACRRVGECVCVI